MIGNKCGACGKRNVILSTDTGLCVVCMEKAYGDEVMKTKVPNFLAWDSRPARAGKKRIHFEVPIKQRSLVDLNKVYTIIIKLKE